MKLISSPCEVCGKFKEWANEQSLGYDHEKICHCVTNKPFTQIVEEINEKGSKHHVYFHFKNNFILDIRNVSTSERNEMISAFTEYQESERRTLLLKHNNQSYSYIIKDLNHDNYINVIDLDYVIRVYSEPAN